MLFTFRNNGSTRAMYGIRFELYYSTNAVVSSPTNFLADLLVDSLGFSREKAISTSAKTNRLKPNRTKAVSVINFFEKVGMNKPQIKSLVSTSPSLLFADVDKTLKPKIEVLRELGLSDSDLVKCITKSACFLSRGIDTFVRPNLDYLRKVMSGDDSVVKVIMKDPRLLCKNIRVVMPPNVALLQNLGFSSRDIGKVMFWRPKLLISSSEWLKEVVYRVEKLFLIPRESPMFIHGVVALSSLDKSNLERKQKIYRDFGWPNSDIYTMVQNLPYCLTISDAKLRIRLKFFMKELGYGSSYLASHPAILKYSFEKRVVPRNDILKVLKEKQLIKSELNLYSVLVCSDVQFFKKYVLTFRDELPEVYDIYIKSR